MWIKARSGYLVNLSRANYIYYVPETMLVCADFSSVGIIGDDVDGNWCSLTSARTEEEAEQYMTDLLTLLHSHR